MRNPKITQSEIDAIISTKDITSMLRTDLEETEIKLLNSDLDGEDFLFQHDDTSEYTALQYAIMNGDMEQARMIKLHFYQNWPEVAKQEINNQIMRFYKTSIQNYKNIFDEMFRHFGDYNGLEAESSRLNAVLTNNDINIDLLEDAHDKTQQYYAKLYQMYDSKSYTNLILTITESGFTLTDYTFWERPGLQKYYNNGHQLCSGLDTDCARRIYASSRNNVLAQAESNETTRGARWWDPDESWINQPEWTDQQLTRFLWIFYKMAFSEMMANSYHLSGLLEYIRFVENSKPTTSPDEQAFDERMILIKIWLLNWVKENGLKANNLSITNFQNNAYNPAYIGNLSSSALTGDLYITGSSETTIISSQPISNKSEKITSQNNIGPLYLLMLTISKAETEMLPRKMCKDVWLHILGFVTLGFSNTTRLEEIGALALQTRNSFIGRTPDLLTRTQYFLVYAAMRGDKDLVLNILRHATKDDAHIMLGLKATVKNFLGVEHTVTALQAAVMCNDIILINTMKEQYFNTFGDGMKMMHDQILEIYSESLTKYCLIEEEHIQKIKGEIALIEKLKPLQDEKKTIERKKYDPSLGWKKEDPTDPERLASISAEIAAISAEITAIINKTPDVKNIEELLEKLKKQCAKSGFKVKAYKAALESKDIRDIFVTHNFAQKNNSFNYKYYILRIIEENIYKQANRASNDESKLDLNNLSVPEVLNYFRRDFVYRAGQEIISNPYHLRAIASNQGVDPHSKTDSELKKNNRIYIFLYGWTSRNTSECQRQEVRLGLEHVPAMLLDNTATTPTSSRPSFFLSWHRNPQAVSPARYGYDSSITNPSREEGWGYNFAPNIEGFVDTYGRRYTTQLRLLDQIIDIKRRTMLGIIKEISSEKVPENSNQESPRVDSFEM